MTGKYQYPGTPYDESRLYLAAPPVHILQTTYIYASYPVRPCSCHHASQRQDEGNSTLQFISEIRHGRTKYLPVSLETRIERAMRALATRRKPIRAHNTWRMQSDAELAQERGVLTLLCSIEVFAQTNEPFGLCGGHVASKTSQSFKRRVSQLTKLTSHTRNVRRTKPAHCY